MKHISALLALVFLGWAANAQSTDNNNSSDTSHRHHANHNNWNHSDNKDRNDDGAMNHFDHRGGMDREHSFGNHNRFGKSMREMHFTPEQRKEMQAINMDYRKKSADLYKMDNITLKEYKSQLLALQKGKKSKLQNILTPEQKNKMAEFKKKRAENAQVMGAAHLERMKIKLNLTEQQTATIKSQEQNLREQMRSIRENDNLMREQKMEQMDALIAKQKDAIKSVLTPEQQTQFESIHKQRFGAK